MKTDEPVKNYTIIAFLMILLEVFCLKTGNKIFLYFYGRYIDVINTKLDPEEFIRITEKEYKKSRNRRYRSYMKVNLAAGYASLGNPQKAYRYLMLINPSDKKAGFNNEMRIMYYYNLALTLHSIGRKDEAIRIYERDITPFLKNLHSNMRSRLKKQEMEGMIDYIACFLFYEEDIEKMVEGLSQSIKKTKVKRYILSRKFLLATYKEKAGKLEEAEELYKEVARKGNKLHIVHEAKERLTEIAGTSSS